MNRSAILHAVGVDPRRMFRGLTGFPRYVRDARRYSSLNRRDTFRIRLRYAFPILNEFHSQAGTARGHYFHQDLWAARLIYKRRPKSHLDIGSRIDGFVAHLLVFMPVSVIDVRPLTGSVPGLTFVQGNATELSGLADDSVPSLSCLHAIEHFGLGRYGDEIDPEGPFKALTAMARVVTPGGYLYLSTPVGRERVEFNGHRVFDPQTIIDECPLRLVSFSAVDDAGEMHPDVSPNNCRGSSYACGLYEFTK